MVTMFELFWCSANGLQSKAKFTLSASSEIVSTGKLLSKITTAVSSSSDSADKTILTEAEWIDLLKTPIDIPEPTGSTDFKLLITLKTGKTKLTVKVYY